ncbi:HEAT repeat domain-containing protein [Halobium salinum]|uniref:HEAT repeat domain-containing protein n=1 Tax=Halobium salinum TaxID=1364940 RepID=A0ABD5P774_9EURY|nr:HEAT repeat domain-containing protein [Halobium salinum]
MTDGDDGSDEEPTTDADESPEEASEPSVDPSETGDLTQESLQARLEAAEDQLDAADTESDLDEVEASLDAIEADIEEADLPEPDEDDEDADDPQEELETQLSALRDELEDQRGPYAEDVVSEIEDAKSTVEETRWTEQGEREVVEAVESFVGTLNEAFGSSVSVDGESSDAAAAALDESADAVENAALDADEDEETIATLLEATDELSTGVDDAQAFDDLEIREQLAYEGFYDVLGHYKDYPVEWSALKEHEQRGNVEMVLLALDTLGSEFMEEHCMEALIRMGDARAFDAMHQRAQKRDKPAIKALGKMGSGAEDAVETLVEYVDSDKDPGLQKVTFRALGEIGDERATQPLADKLEMDNHIVRPHAARALGLLGDTRAVKPLVDVLENDGDDSARASAAWALRQIGTEDALEAAAEHSDDRSFLVQDEASRANDALGTTRSGTAD